MARRIIADFRMLCGNFREKPVSKTLAVSLHLKDCIIDTPEERSSVSIARPRLKSVLALRI
jgi:hypothetical protein